MEGSGPALHFCSISGLRCFNCLLSYHRDITGVCFQEGCFQDAPIEMSALFQYAIILFCQENLFKSCKIKSVLNRSWHNGNEILGCPISMQV